MINTGRITQTLQFLETEYNRHSLAKDQKIPILISKMALLEYCGWLEESFDDIARNCVRELLKTKASRKVLEDKIRRTHGFTYKESFRPLLVYGLGTVRLIEFEKQLDKDGTLSTLRSDLGRLNEMRKEAAHTFTSGRTSKFDAPSLVIANFNRTEPALKKIWHLVRE